jgi:hypothetical protein
VQWERNEQNHVTSGQSLKIITEYYNFDQMEEDEKGRTCCMDGTDKKCVQSSYYKF